jgi:hypothetical protein
MVSATAPIKAAPDRIRWTKMFMPRNVPDHRFLPPGSFGKPFGRRQGSAKLRLGQYAQSKFHRSSATSPSGVGLTAAGTP